MALVNTFSSRFKTIINRGNFWILFYLGRMGIVGLTQGLPNHVWYTWLDRFLPGKSLMVVSKKVLADQLIASPFSSSTFFVGASLLEGCSLAESVNEFRSKFLMVYMVS